MILSAGKGQGVKVPLNKREKTIAKSQRVKDRSWGRKGKEKITMGQAESTKRGRAERFKICCRAKKRGNKELRDY